MQLLRIIQNQGNRFFLVAVASLFIAIICAAFWPMVVSEFEPTNTGQVVKLLTLAMFVVALAAFFLDAFLTLYHVHH